MLGFLTDITFLTGLVQNYWYLGAFVVGLLSSVSLFLPSPAFVIIFVTAPMFNPFLLGLVAGIGAAFGELTGYYGGLMGKKFLSRYAKQMQDVQDKFNRYNPNVFLFVFSASPLPFDVVGLFCGLIRYPVWKFFVPLLLGKIVKYWIIAYAGFYGISFLGNLFS